MMSTVYIVHTQWQSLQSMKESVLIDTPVIKSLGASYHIVFPGSSQDDSLFFSVRERNINNQKLYGSSTTQIKI